MLPHDPQGKIGPKVPLPDHVSIAEPKDSDSKIEHPYSTCVEKQEPQSQAVEAWADCFFYS